LRDEIKSELLQMAKALSPEQLPRFFGDLEEIRCTAELQLRSAAKCRPAGDALLTVAEASKLPNVSADTLYRRDFPFTRHVGRRRLFSRIGIDNAIQQNDLHPGLADANITRRRTARRLG
jgi:hypothetical protein